MILANFASHQITRSMFYVCPGTVSTVPEQIVIPRAQTPEYSRRVDKSAEGESQRIGSCKSSLFASISSPTLPIQNPETTRDTSLQRRVSSPPLRGSSPPPKASSLSPDIARRAKSTSASPELMPHIESAQFNVRTFALSVSDGSVADRVGNSPMPTVASSLSPQLKASALMAHSEDSPTSERLFISPQISGSAAQSPLGRSKPPSFVEELPALPPPPPPTTRPPVSLPYAPPPRKSSLFLNRDDQPQSFAPPWKGAPPSKSPFAPPPKGTPPSKLPFAPPPKGVPPPGMPPSRLPYVPPPSNAPPISGKNFAPLPSGAEPTASLATPIPIRPTSSISFATAGEPVPHRLPPCASHPSATPQACTDSESLDEIDVGSGQQMLDLRKKLASNMSRSLRSKSDSRAHLTVASFAARCSIFVVFRAWIAMCENMRREERLFQAKRRLLLLRAQDDQVEDEQEPLDHVNLPAFTPNPQHQLDAKKSGKSMSASRKEELVAHLSSRPVSDYVTIFFVLIANLIFLTIAIPRLATCPTQQVHMSTTWLLGTISFALFFCLGLIDVFVATAFAVAKVRALCRGAKANCGHPEIITHRRLGKSKTSASVAPIVHFARRLSMGARKVPSQVRRASTAVSTQLPSKMKSFSAVSERVRRFSILSRPHA